MQIEKIREMRKKAGLSQKQLGEMLGISNRAVSKWENGVSLPSSRNLVALSKIFGVPLSHFAAEEGKEKAAPGGMESLTALYKIGRGPSSSHTIGPERACTIMKKRYPGADFFKVFLYGSLAKTGKGHGTDSVVQKTFAPVKCSVEFCVAAQTQAHPNTMDICAYAGEGELGRARVYSVGGGSIVFEGEPQAEKRLIYPHTSFKEISEYCAARGLRLWQYAEETEDADFWAYMTEIWEQMKRSIQAGLLEEGILPGGLGVHKKAKHLFSQQHIDESRETRENRIVCAYAFAVSEQNASGERIVTAPTCGAAGVLPAVLYYQQEKHSLSDRDILRALATAGIVGNLIKTNASISGAECGCQVEIGCACAMAAAALGELFGLHMDKIEYAAEMAIEHHLGLTCDPICGLVQIPCIERNAVAAMRAINAVNLASFLSDTRKISFDKVVRAMRETGEDMSASYKETAEGGLAKIGIE